MVSSNETILDLLGSTYIKKKKEYQFFPQSSNMFSTKWGKFFQFNIVFSMKQNTFTIKLVISIKKSCNLQIQAYQRRARITGEKKKQKQKPQIISCGHHLRGWFSYNDEFHYKWSCFQDLPSALKCNCLRRLRKPLFLGLHGKHFAWFLITFLSRTQCYRSHFSQWCLYWFVLYKYKHIYIQNTHTDTGMWS